MKITNNYNLPTALVNAIVQTQSEYDNQGSNISASSITTPPRIYWLKKRHADSLSIDAVDLVWSFIGTATHYAAEKAAMHDGELIAEERFFKEVLGWKVSSQIDNFSVSTGHLTDFKITSVYSITGKPKFEWQAQLNMQAQLLKENGYNVTKLQICAIGRDWSKHNVFKKDYPKKQVKLINIPIWGSTETNQYIEQRIKLLQSHENTPDDRLPECSQEDMWATDDTYAVMKDKKAKRATKIHPNLMSANAHAETIGGIVVKRDGERRRCESYCDVASKCNQYQDWRKK